MRKSLFLLLPALLAYSQPALAEDYTLILKDHRFSPADLELPAGQKIKLTVKNEQNVPAEFESAELNREKVVNAGSEIIVFLGPLDAGTYKYFDDFHRETTGTIIVK